jgi:hypothetical protein
MSRAARSAPVIAEFLGNDERLQPQEIPDTNLFL